MWKELDMFIQIYLMLEKIYMTFNLHFQTIADVINMTYDQRQFELENSLISLALKPRLSDNFLIFLKKR